MESRAVRKRLCPNWVGRCHGVPVWRSNELWILQPGKGLCGAIRCILALQEMPNIQDVWLAGWCGGLNPVVQCGDIILPDCVATVEGNRFPLTPSRPIDAIAKDVAWTLGVTVHSGPVLSSERLVHDSAEKRTLEHAIAVEMEALPLYTWTTQTHKGFFHLRVVLDPVDSSLPVASFWNTVFFWSQAKSITRFFYHARKANRILAGVVEAFVKHGLKDVFQDVNSVERVAENSEATAITWVPEMRYDE
jgi:nucleoside phosphorylase